RWNHLMIFFLNGFGDIVWVKDSQLRIPHRVARKRSSYVIAPSILGAKDQCREHTQCGQISGQKVIQDDGWRQLWSIGSTFQHRIAGTTVGVHVKATALGPWSFPAERAKGRIDDSRSQFGDFFCRKTELRNLPPAEILDHDVGGTQELLGFRKILLLRQIAPR